MTRDNSETAKLQDSQYRTLYPFAAAPDIIRSNQKDVYFQGTLGESLSSALRSVYGARFVHRYSSETKIFSDLLYLSCTTLIGNRTLGEEYCDIVQVESDTLKLPSALRRCGYILSSIAIPYFLNKGLPKLRIALTAWLQASSRSSDHEKSEKLPTNTLRIYLLKNLSTLTSPAPIYAMGLAVFYFSGAYYHVSKRAWGLRYLFSKRIGPLDQRIGYEVLGILLVLQLSVQLWLHMQNTYYSDAPSIPNTENLIGGLASTSDGVELTVRSMHISNVPLEQDNLLPANQVRAESQLAINVPDRLKYSLADPNVLAWIDGRQQRKCTLCLEELKDPSTTTCGHVFCWSCISDWIKEKPECPLCRQHVLAQHVLPLRD